MLSVTARVLWRATVFPAYLPTIPYTIKLRENIQNARSLFLRAKGIYLSCIGLGCRKAKLSIVRLVSKSRDEMSGKRNGFEFNKQTD